MFFEENHRYGYSFGIVCIVVVIVIVLFCNISLAPAFYALVFKAFENPFF